MARITRPPVRPVSRGMANDSMSSLNLARALENARADSLTSRNLAVAFQPDRSISLTSENLTRALLREAQQKPEQQTNTQRPATEKREK